MTVGSLRSRPREVLSAALLVSLLACGGGSGVPTGMPPDETPEAPGEGPSPPASHILGRFSLVVLLAFTDLSSGERRTRLCAGAVRVGELDGPSFAGAFSIESSGECLHGQSGSIAGRVRELGGLEFDLVVEGRRPNELPDLTGCAYAGEAGRFGGAINAKRFAATSSSAVLCTVPEGPARSFELRIRIDGEREGPAD